VIKVGFVAEVIIEVSSVLDQVSQGSDALGQETNDGVNDQEFQSQTNEEGGNPVVGGSVILFRVQFAHVPDAERPENDGAQEDAEIETEDSVLGLLVPGFFSSLVVLVLSNIVASQYGTHDVNESPINKHGVNSINNDVGLSEGIVGSSVPDRGEEGVDGEGTEKQGHSGLSGVEVVTNVVNGIERMVGPSVFLVFRVLDGLFTEHEVDDEPENDDDDTEP